MDKLDDIPVPFRERFGRRKVVLILAAGGLSVLVAAGVVLARCSDMNEGNDPIADSARTGKIPIPGDRMETRTPEATSVAEAEQVTGSGEAHDGNDGQATSENGADRQGLFSSGESASVGTPTPIAPLIAYRSDGSLWVAREDGSNPAKVAPYKEGPFSLSPDGKRLAVVSGGVMVIVRVETGAITIVGPASSDRPQWLRDSSAVLYVRAASDGSEALEVWRVPASGVGARRILHGKAPRVADNGTIVALPEMAGAGSADSKGFMWVLRPSAAPERIVARGAVTAADVSGERVVYATLAPESEAGGPAIWSTRLDGSDARKIVQAPSTDRPFAFTEVCLSPDGRYLMAALTGDDGYARTQIVCLTTGKMIQLSLRRDTYPLGWNSDGTGVFFVEGNAFQGEPTAVLCVRLDGTGRSVLVKRAGIW